ncbi:PIN-like domain-containing protein [Bradyrhizobium elkanii]
MPEAIRSARPTHFSVEYHHDPKNKFRFSDQTPDDEWISKVAGEGWIIFSHDRKFHTLLSEAAAIKQHNAGCFYLPGASLPTWDKVHYFMRSYQGIMRRVMTTKRPFIFELMRTGRFVQRNVP